MKPVRSLPTAGLNASSVSLDKAVVYLHRQSASADRGAVNVKSLLQKIDRRIIPIAFVVYTLQLIDKININYAAVMGLNKDLRLVGNEFNNAASAMFIANLVAEVPTGYILQKVPPGKWLGINVILWGIATACTASVQSYRGLLACRIFLGIFEAAVSPCLMLITGMWYTKPEAVPRFTLWYCGLGVGQILGGIVSWGFQHIAGNTLSGWRVMFIVLGVLTANVGLWTFFYMPNNPMEVNWLTEQEKNAAIGRVAVNQTGIENRHFKWSHLKELVLDIQIWLLVVMTILISISSGIITTYSSTLIRNFGYTPRRAALLNMPSGAVTIVSSIISGYFAGKHSCRWMWIIGLALPAVLGSALMSFLPSTNQPGLLAGIYLVNSITPILVLIYSWAVANVAGQTKRVVANALISGSFSIGNIIGPQTFQAKDAPQFIHAKIAALSTQATVILFAVLTRLYYGWQNSKKDAVERIDKEGFGKDATKIENIEWLNLTDKENKTFRYHY